MKLRVFSLTLIVAAVVTGLIQVQPTSALTVTGLTVTLDCTRGDFLAFTAVFDRNNTGAGAETVYIQVTDGAGKILHYNSSSVPLGTYSIPTEGFTYNISLPEFNPLTVVFVSIAGNNLPEQIVYQTTGMCAGLPWATPPGPTHPAGFEQHDIICDTAVYDAPGGSPVGEDMVYAGQDWHVNPVPEMGPDGQNWTQIFVGGEFLGYIPTGCVGGVTPWN